MRERDRERESEIEMKRRTYSCLVFPYSSLLHPGPTSLTYVDRIPSPVIVSSFIKPISGSSNQKRLKR
jgi:hypothetical protein